MSRTALQLVLIAALASSARAEPAPPSPGPLVAGLSVGVFCAQQSMDQRPAPGTISGWIHVPDGQISFHWPDRQVVPAALGLAFGIKARLQPGETAAFAEMRVYRPGTTTPEVWGSTFGDLDDTLDFFRFDRSEELVLGIWRFEAWNGDTRLYQVEFEVVPAAALPEIVNACGAVS
jgi:hypothetical protein